MKRTILCLFVLVSASCFAQMTTTPAQHARLMKQRAKLIHLQAQNSKLQAELAFETGQLTKACRQVASENGWPMEAQCELMTMTFYQPRAQPPMPPQTSAPPAKEPEAKPEPKPETK